MSKFDIFKTEIIKRCKEKSACEPEFKRILASENFEQIAKVLTDNFNWSCNNKIIDCELIEPLNDELLQFNLCANVQKVTNCFILLNGSSSAELFGSSSAELFGSSSAELNDSSYICSYNILEHKLSDNAICRYYYQNKIVVSKTTEIVTY